MLLKPLGIIQYGHISILIYSSLSCFTDFGYHLETENLPVPIMFFVLFIYTADHYRIRMLINTPHLSLVKVCQNLSSQQKGLCCESQSDLIGSGGMVIKKLLKHNFYIQRAISVPLTRHRQKYSKYQAPIKEFSM